MKTNMCNIKNIVKLEIIVIIQRDIVAVHSRFNL